MKTVAGMGLEECVTLGTRVILSSVLRSSVPSVVSSETHSTFHYSGRRPAGEGDPPISDIFVGV